MKILSIVIASTSEWRNVKEVEDVSKELGVKIDLIDASSPLGVWMRYHYPLTKSSKVPANLMQIRCKEGIIITSVFYDEVMDKILKWIPDAKVK